MYWVAVVAAWFLVINTLSTTNGNNEKRESSEVSTAARIKRIGQH